MKKLSYLSSFLLTLLFIFIGCKKTSTGTDSSSSSQSLAIRLVNTGSGDFDVDGNPDGYYNFCYDSEPCSSTGSGGFGATAFEGQKSIFVHSDPDKQAVGVKIHFYVTNGSGKIEILSGTSHGTSIFDDNYGFDIDKVVHTEGPFSKGDEITFNYGKTTN